MGGKGGGAALERRVDGRTGEWWSMHGGIESTYSEPVRSLVSAGWSLPPPRHAPPSGHAAPPASRRPHLPVPIGTPSSGSAGPLPPHSSVDCRPESSGAEQLHALPSDSLVHHPEGMKHSVTFQHSTPPTSLSARVWHKGLPSSTSVVRAGQRAR